MDRVGPDEFAVESRAPLTIPPEYDLRPPQPGAPRPQEGTAADKARKVIDTAGPGEPGKQATAGLRVPTGGATGGGPQLESGQQATSGLRVPPGGGVASSGPQPDTSQQVGDQSLASKLLGANDSAAGGPVEKRETTTLKGVY